MLDRIKYKLNSIEELKHLSTGNNLLLLGLRMMLLILLFHMKDNAILSIFMPVFVIPGLLIRKIALNKYYWLLFAVVTVYFYLIMDLENYVPNHRHIFAYLSLAITIGLFFNSFEKVLIFLKIQAKQIIGLCFLFAVIGKLLAPEFLNGSFFEFTNIVDPRFFGFTANAGNVELTNLHLNNTIFQNLLNTSEPNSSFYLNTSTRLETLGIILSYWTIFIEAMIAISFLVPVSFKISKIRDYFLAAFIITTYPIATVTGFALILATMGFFQSVSKNGTTSFTWFYLLVYCLVPLNYIPFARLFNFF